MHPLLYVSAGNLAPDTENKDPFVALDLVNVLHMYQLLLFPFHRRSNSALRIRYYN